MELTMMLHLAEAHPMIELDVPFSDPVVNLVDEGFDGPNCHLG